MPFYAVQQDITTMKVDAIVNAANTGLLPGGGVCGAIFAKAGLGDMAAACKAIGGCPTGQAAITPGFALPAAHVIHTPGPIWRGGGQGEARALAACYANSLALAKSSRCRSIAFPLISAGIYGYPTQAALEIAVDTIGAWLAENPMDVYLCLLDEALVREARRLYSARNLPETCC